MVHLCSLLKIFWENCSWCWAYFFQFYLLIVLLFAAIIEQLCYSITGPTSFAPIIEMAMTIVEESGGQYHVLLIIADGQVFVRLVVGIVFLLLTCACKCNYIIC